MSRELIIATRVTCDLCGDTEVVLATSDMHRVNRMLTTFHEWTADADDVCLGCQNAYFDDLCGMAEAIP